MSKGIATKWNGQPVIAQCARVEILESSKFSKYWASNRVGQVVKAVIVTFPDLSRMCLFNNDGSGLAVVEAEGSPSYPFKEIAEWEVKEFKQWPQ